MRPVSLFANGPASEIEQLQAGLRGPWRQAARAVMVLLSLHGLAPAQIAELLDCHPSTVRRWISRSASQRPFTAGHEVRLEYLTYRMGSRRGQRQPTFLLLLHGPDHRSLGRDEMPSRDDGLSDDSDANSHSLTPGLLT